MNRWQLAVAALRGKAAVGPVDVSALDSRLASAGSGGWFAVIREAFSGAWQRNIVVDNPEDLLAFSAVYACISLIAEDIAKLRLTLKRQDDDDIWLELKPREQSPFLRVIAKPNQYQTRQQFISQWVTSKLINGNAYVLKEREAGRGLVRSLYVLDPRLVTPRVTSDGDVYYELRRDPLAGVRQDNVFVPANEIIHDRCITPWHPLVGLSPIYAAATAATQGRRIQSNSAKFFQNMSRPSGQLTSPGPIGDELALRLKKQFEEEFSGGNIGRLLVGGSGLKYEPMSMPANEAQLIEQLRWTVEDVCRCFPVPPHKLLAGPALALNNVGALAQEYFNTALQKHMEAIEELLSLGLELPAGMAVEFDTDGLLRLDPAAQADADSKEIGAGIMAPNEARWKRDLRPMTGGDTPYLQQQNYSLAALARRDAMPPEPTAVPALPAPKTPPTQDGEDPPAEPQKRVRLADVKAHAKVSLYGREFRIAA